MYDKILVTLDGSDLAGTALPEVARVAGPDTEVIVAEVIDSVGQILTRTSGGAGFALSEAGETTIDAADVVIAHQRTGAEGYLEAARELLLSRGIAKVTARVLEGTAGPMIVRLADEENVDVIVMATHGRSGVSRALLGSVSDHVVRHTERASVLLVRPKENSGASTKGDAVGASAGKK